MPASPSRPRPAGAFVVCGVAAVGLAFFIRTGTKRIAPGAE